MLENIDLKEIQDENARELIQRLLNLVEKLSLDLRDSQGEVQRLRDEVNRLKGEQGQPKIKGNTPKPPPSDISSEKERQTARPRHKSHKNSEIKINREQEAAVDPAILPADAQFKGHEDVVVQDILLSPDNVLFHKQKYYAASTKTTYLAELPRGYAGQFGPGIKALTTALYFGMGTSEPKIREFYENVGIQISEGEISNLLIKDQAGFHAEKDAVYEAGLKSSPWQQTDDTATRVAGQNQHCHVVCNPVYTSFHTRPSKERLVVLDVLRQGRQRIFRLNAEALGYLETLAWSKKTWRRVQSWSAECAERDLEESFFRAQLEVVLPHLGQQQRKALIDAAAVAAYHAETDFPVVQALICDDAPQFNWLSWGKMLCWVHAGRHFKKLIPVVALHRDQLADFLKRFWAYYHQLWAYTQKPTAEESARLETEFDVLFATRTGYAELDQRIALTQAKKANLLLVLKYPELPLHNNDAELGARQRVRKRDVSFGPRTQDGVRAWDTFATLAATAKKLGVSFYHYLYDRISGKNQIPPLADLVEKRAKELNLGWSWAGSYSCPYLLR
jgi:hypothetical protein